MANRKLNYTIRPAKTLEEAKELWWPLMQQLDWVRCSPLKSSRNKTNSTNQNRAADDANTHFRVAQNGKNWLVIVPESSAKPEGCVVALYEKPGVRLTVRYLLISCLFF
jgi:hypothetical protein